MAVVVEVVEEEEVELSTVVAVVPSCLTGDIRPGLHLTKQKNPTSSPTIGMATRSRTTKEMTSTSKNRAMETRSGRRTYWVKVFPRGNNLSIKSS